MKTDASRLSLHTSLLDLAEPRARPFFWLDGLFPFGLFPAPRL